MEQQASQNETNVDGANSQSYLWLKSYPEHVNWHSTYHGEPLQKLLEDTVANYPEKICSNFLGATLSYKEIGDLTDQVAKGLQEMGLEKGDRVGLMLPNCPSFVIYFYGILKAGGVVVNFNPLYTLEELSFQAKNSQTKIMVSLDLKLLFDKVEDLLANQVIDRAIVCSFPELLPAMKSTLFKLFKGRDLAKINHSSVESKCIYSRDLQNNDGKYRAVAINPSDDVAVLQYTGGTTGRPKGAMLTHANLYINTRQGVDWASDFEYGDEKFIGILPFFHVFALTVVMNFSIAGAAEIIMVPKFELADVIKLISKTRPTRMPGVPTLFNAIMNYDGLPQGALSSLRSCISGGAPLPLEVKNGFEAVSGCKLMEGYGLSETSPILTCNPEDGPPKVMSIGLPFPGTFLSIRSLEDPTIEMPQGERGEICAKGPQVMKGYWQAEEETRQVFVGDYFRTGDVGYMDEDGYTFIVDRLKDLIICSGFNVYPRQIEEAIYEFPAVEEVTVIGIPDEYRGEAPKAFIKLRKGHSATVDEIMTFLKPKLNKIEMPEEIEFREELPKTLVGKLSKKELRDD